ncbi:MAG: hypothetical protein ACRCWW_11220 [Scandinavium sp.]|uniref:hypothetical protein n=1 Tax=Scandinavium sp. TaxID=2830653 RepID=UPI003F3D2656
MGLFGGKVVSQQDYDSVKASLYRLQEKYDALEELCRKYSREIEDKNDRISVMEVKASELREEIEELKNDEAGTPTEPVSIQDVSIFSILGALVGKFNQELCLLSEIKNIKSVMSEYSAALVARHERFDEIKAVLLGQRSHDEGNPIQMGFEIKAHYLNKYEIDVFLSMVRGAHSDSVNGSLMEGGYLDLDVAGGYNAVTSLTFGMFGGEAAPTFSFFTDVYNENWKDEYTSEAYVKIPYEIENLVAKLSYEYRMNIWRSLAEKGLPPLG